MLIFLISVISDIFEQSLKFVLMYQIFGFKQDIVYGVGRHVSEKLVNIMSVNSIVVHCNIIHSGDGLYLHR